MVKFISGPPTPGLGLKFEIERRRHDLLTMVESGAYVPPVAFESYNLLAEWASKHNLERIKASPARLTSAVKIVGRFRRPEWLENQFLPYAQVWARKSYDDHRLVMTRFMADLVDDAATIKQVDSDHVVGRTVLEHHPNSWINLFPVWGSANQGFGSIEKQLAKAQTGFGRMSLTPLTAFKLLRNDKKIKTSDDLDDEIAVAVGKVLKEGEVATKFRSEIEPAVKAAFEKWLIRHTRNSRPAKSKSN